MSTTAAPHSYTYRPGVVQPIVVKRWPSEEILFAITGIISMGMYLMLLISIFGAIYAGFFAVFFFLAHVGFIAHVRGSAVKLGPEQFPELHMRVAELAVAMGMRKVPDAYLMQASGSLNAFATKFLGANIIVLYSDLLEACGNNTAARDMIIAHELGHIRAGHLSNRWLVLPGRFVPFLGTALSRAQEYTCDRYGMAGAGNREGALLGLSILAAGAKHGPLVNHAALVRQRADLNTGWMRIGEWLSTHPPLASRLAQVDPSLTAGIPGRGRGTTRALLIVAAVVLPFVALTFFGVKYVASLAETATDETLVDVDVEQQTRRATEDLNALLAVIQAETQAGRLLPGQDVRCGQPRPDADPLIEEVVMATRWSIPGTCSGAPGPDGQSGTDDDLARFAPGAVGSNTLSAGDTSHNGIDRQPSSSHVSQSFLAPSLPSASIFSPRHS